ncbi:MAG: hypothetical protein HYS18_14685 [Burkholderiales bacterium]|nr:hypothetical protein [Burkholderiales bacterium]
MWITALAAAFLSLILAHSFYTEYMTKEIPWNAGETTKDVGNFHVFALAAELYMRDHAADTSYLPAGTTVVHWSEPDAGPLKGLNKTRGLPDGLKTANIDPSWRIQIASGTYILCTGMTAGGVAKMANLPQSLWWNPSIAWKQGNYTADNSGTKVDMVTFDVNDSTADACK